MVVKVTLRDIGEETILTSDWMMTLLKMLGVGTIEIEPEAMLYPDREICKETDREVTSIRQRTITFDSYIFEFSAISVSVEKSEPNVYLYCTVELPLAKEGTANLLSL